MKHLVAKWLPRFAALTLAAQAAQWVWIFTMTDYRAHRRVPMLAIATVLLVYAFFLFIRNRVVVWSSVLVALAGATALLWMQAMNNFGNWYLVAATAISLCYGLALLWAWRLPGGTGT